MRRSRQHTVREIMIGSPVTLKPEDTLRLANDVISLGRVRHNVGAGGGQASRCFDRARFDRHSRQSNFGSQTENEGGAAQWIKDIMKNRVLTAEPETQISETERLVAAKKLGCLPMVTTTDILRYVERLGYQEAL